METYKIGTEKITFYGKAKGSNKNKFNRVNKLASMYNELHSKLINIAERGYDSCTENYRCAVATILLMETGIRVGNEDSAEGYHTKPHPHAKDQTVKFVKTYGLTTLLKQHVKVKKDLVMFDFIGKKQVENSYIVPKHLTKYIKQVALNNTEPIFGITDYQLTKFIKRYVGKQFTPKDFRTLRANILAEQKISNYDYPATKKEAKQIVKEVAEYVSSKLSNTPAVCKRSYINEFLFTENLPL